LHKARKFILREAVCLETDLCQSNFIYIVKLE